MAHAVSALYPKFNRMSPTAAALAALLHAAVVLVLLWGSPLRPVEAAEEAIEFTVQDVIPPPGETQTPASPTPEPTPSAPAVQPPTAKAPAVAPSAQPNLANRLGLPSRSLTPDPRAIPAPPQAEAKPIETKPPETETAEPAKPEPEKAEPPKPEPEKQEPAKAEADKPEPAKPEPAKPEPERQLAAAAPPPAPAPPEPKLEQVLPPVEAPPPPIAAQDFPKPAPPPPTPPKPPQPQAPPQPPPQQRAQTPPPQQQQLQPSPRGRAPQQRPPANSQAAAQPSPLTNPASQYGQRKAQDDYLWQVMRKMSQYHYTPKSSVISEEGVVTMRITVARDGRLIEVSLVKSSGFPTLDNGVMETIRLASPFAPLPAEIPGAQHTFILPVNYVYRGVR